jgi:predicted RNase H-like HicB family nuclease
MEPLKIIVEKHPDGYVAYPAGMKGIVIGEGDTYDEAVADVTAAIRFHIETFGKDELSDDEIIDGRGSGDYTTERKQWLEKDPEKYLAAVIVHGKKKSRS